ncbi:MAG: aspartyl protease family protein, partial [Bacteroidota bacterium]
MSQQGMYYRNSHMKIRLFSSLLLPLFLVSCSVEKLQQAGTVDPTDFNTKVSFETYKGVISLDFSVDGQVRKFLFDTGADLTVMQRDSISGKTYNVSGASKRKMELGRETVTSMRIGSVDFQNTYALNGDLSGLKEQIPAFGGLLGQSIIGKANWLI